MFTSRRIVITIGAASLVACAAQAPSRKPAFGAAVSAEEIARWDISIPPSGAGLPKGGGSARQGLQVYEQKCMACHAAKRAAKPAHLLARAVAPLPSTPPLLTVATT